VDQSGRLRDPLSRAELTAPQRFKANAPALIARPGRCVVRNKRKPPASGGKEQDAENYELTKARETMRYQPWTEEQDATVIAAQIPDVEIALQLGCTIHAVRSRRRTLRNRGLADPVDRIRVAPLRAQKPRPRDGSGVLCVRQR